MQLKSLLLFIPFCFLACKEKTPADEIVIEGMVKNIPDGKLYLTEAHYWNVPLDSTECVHGHFVFRIKADSSFVPYMAAVHFPDSTKPTKVGGLFYRNYMVGADSMKQNIDGFYLEKGYTLITGDNTKPPHLRVFAGRETDVMYKNIATDFGWLGNADSVQRMQRTAFFKKEIKACPYSYYLLQSIYNAKDQYSERELGEILSLFNKDVQNSKAGDRFKTYLVNRPDPGVPYPNLLLVNAAGQKSHIIDSNAKLNMLVFWASWCGPCRMEIPVLKEIQQVCKGKGLNLVSISVDENTGAWVKAVNQEKMSWPQYLVDSADKELVKQQFNFAAIPLVVFTGREGKEIARFTGYEKENSKLYRTVIKKFID